MILLIDNYDSFSYNLYQMLGELGHNIKVVRNDEISPEDIMTLRPSCIVLSPGPGRPEDAGVCIDVVRSLGSSIPILGVCLGHQAICAAYGGVVTYAKNIIHGKQSEAILDLSCPLFAGCPERALVARYHSLAADRGLLPNCLTVTARAEDGEIMAVAHRSQPVYGVQFHPESVITPHGKKILENFVRKIGKIRKMQK